MKLRLNIILFLLLGLQLSASPLHPGIRNYTKAAYHAGAQNWDIAEAPDGSIYFANNFGLLAFDGHNWDLYRANNYTDVRSLCIDPETRNIYMGASNELGALSFNDGQCSYTSLLRTEETGTLGEIWAIHRVEGRICFRENNKIRFVGGDSGVQTFTFESAIQCSGVIDGILYLVIQGKGAYRYQDGDFTAVQGTGNLAGTNVRTILKAKDEILFVTESDGIFSLESGALHPSALAEGISSDNIFCATAAGDILAVGTVSDGVILKNTATGDILKFDTGCGLQKNTVLSLAFDRAGNLWLGLNNGIDCLLLNEAEWRLFDGNDNYGAGYAAGVSGGYLYLGTNQGLFRTRYDGSRDSLSGEPEPWGHIRWQVWAIDEYDGLLFCSHDKGLSVIGPDGTVDNIPLPGCWKVIPLKGNPDYLLGSTYYNLFLLEKKGGKWRFAAGVSGFEEASKSFEEDPQDGSIWFSHWIKGLYNFKLSPEKALVSDIVYHGAWDGLPYDSSNYPGIYSGRIVISTPGGFFRYDEEAGRMVPEEGLNSKFDGLPVSVQTTQLSDSLYYYSSGSFQGVGIGDGPVDSLSLKGLAERRIAGFDCTKMLGKDILVNTEDGFSLILTDRLERGKKTANPVYIRDVSVLRGESDSSVFVSRRPADEHIIRLPSGDNSLRFTVSCPSFANDPLAVTYSCMLDGYDSGWAALKGESSKEYTRLPGGKYTFRVRATDHYSGSESETSIGVHIATPWYLSGWMILVYFVLAVIFITGLYLMVSSRARRKEEQRQHLREEALRREQMGLDLRRKADDLAASTMNNIRKNEVLISIASSLLKMEDQDKDSRRSTIRRLRSEIQESIEHDDDWGKFSENFDIVYSDFLKRLSAEYPSLNASDKKLCAYLRMDLSSKEISPLLNMSVHSVETTRYRLRKKLRLSKGDNLSDFLRNF